MSRPYEIVCTADDEQWHAARMTGIGASEIACVLGCGFMSALELYYIKRGETPEPEFDQESLFWGRILEPAIIKGYAQRSGRWATPSGQLLRSLEHPWMLCTLDSWTATWPGAGPPIRAAQWPLEIKNWSSYAADQWAQGAPEKYRLQVHQQMIVTDRQRGTVAGLLGGQQLAWEDVDRNEQDVRRIIYGGNKFWQQVQDGTPPDADGSDSAARALRNRYPRHEERTVYLDGEHTAIALKTRRLRDTSARDKRHAKEYENTLKQLMGTADRAEGDGVVVTWRTDARGVRAMRITEKM